MNMIVTLFGTQGWILLGKSQHGLKNSFDIFSNALAIEMNVAPRGWRNNSISSKDAVIL